jgi:mRNA interferase MazF
MLRQASTQFDDWLVSMISSQLQQSDFFLDEVLQPGEADFAQSGLKVASVLRLSRLAVLDGALFAGCLGSINDQRLQQIRQRLAAWIVGDDR